MKVYARAYAGGLTEMATGFCKLQEPLVEYCVVYAYLLEKINNNYEQMSYARTCEVGITVL